MNGNLQFHELRFARELQNSVLHYGNITTMTAKPSIHAPKAQFTAFPAISRKA
jgi:hypothetical protein